MRGRPFFLGLLGCLLYQAPVSAGTVAFEDHAVLETGQWQLNSIFSVYPNTQKVEGTQISALEPTEASLLGQLYQEFRYGLTDRLMIRTTLPLSLLQDGTGSSGGLGDWEVFLKAGLLTEEAAPFSLAAGLQVLMPTSLPRLFSLNGTTNIVPSLMLNAPLGPGEVTANAGYARALEYESEGHRVHPSDSVVYALGWSADVTSRFNVALELLGSETLASQTDGVEDAGSTSRQISLGPGATWAIDDAQALLLSLQMPVWRQGTFGASQPVSGLVQYSVTF